MPSRPLLSEKAIKRIKQGKSYSEKHDPWSIGYWSRGETYIIASNGKQTDSMTPNDLVAITFNGTVVQLRPTTNPELIELVTKIVSEIKETR